MTGIDSLNSQVSEGNINKIDDDVDVKKIGDDDD